MIANSQDLMLEPTIAYPALVFGRDVLTIAGTERDLHTCTTKAVENGYFRGILLVDASSRRLRIRDARVVRKENLFRGWPFYDSRLVRISLDVEKVDSIALSEVKDLVRATVNRHPRSFAAGYADPAELEATIRDAPSVGALAKALR